MEIPIKIYYRRNARNLTARRNSDGTIRVTMPYGIPPARQRELIDTLMHRIAEKPMKSDAPLFADGMTLECDGLTFLFHTSDSGSNLIKATINHHSNTAEAMITIPRELDTSDAFVQKRISDLMIKIAAVAGKKMLTDIANALSLRLGVRPAAWKIGRGRRTLGTCHSDRTITLSSLLVFLPAELKEYIICHELAHLTEMNHSPRFHHLCDQYLGGREKQLAKALKTYRWPILR